MHSRARRSIVAIIQNDLEQGAAAAANREYDFHRAAPPRYRVLFDAIDLCTDGEFVRIQPYRVVLVGDQAGNQCYSVRVGSRQHVAAQTYADILVSRDFSHRVTLVNPLGRK